MFGKTTDSSNPSYTKRQEKRLIDRLRSGDQDAARQIIDAHKDRLHAFVWRILRNHHDAEELSQEAFLKAFANLESYSSKYRFSTWLFTIAYRLCLNSLRRKHALTGEIDFSHLSSGATSAADQVAQSEEARRLKVTIWEAVDRLSVPQRATVLLFYREELSCQDISEVLGMPVATVKSHLHRARGKLQEMLSPIAGSDWSGLRVVSEAG